MLDHQHSWTYTVLSIRPGISNRSLLSHFPFIFQNLYKRIVLPEETFFPDETKFKNLSSIIFLQTMLSLNGDRRNGNQGPTIHIPWNFFIRFPFDYSIRYIHSTIFSTLLNENSLN